MKPIDKTTQTSRLFADKSDLYAAARPTYPPELFDFSASLAVT